MEATLLAWIGFVWWGASTVIHWLSAALARQGRHPKARDAGTLRPVSDFSIVAPMVGADDASSSYIGSLKILSALGTEIFICVASKDDPACSMTRALWPDAPILVGADTTFNPKMNNVRKGLEAATRPIVALCDAGIEIEPDALRRAGSPLSEGVGLVLALKAGVGAGNFAAELECAYINGHQARFLLAADRIGLTVASGGITLMTHDTLQRIGNWRGFNRWIADDYSVTRSVRELGLKTRLGEEMMRLPLGVRGWRTVWRRQVRWARTRLRLPVWPLVLWEPLIGWLISGAAGVIGLALAGCDPAWIAAGVLGHTLAWLAGEKWFLSGRGLAFGPRAAAAAMVRELLSPALMLTALSRRSIDWRGTDLGGQWRARGDATTAESSEEVRGWQSQEPRISEGMPTEEIRIVTLPERVDSATSASVENMLFEVIRPGKRMIVDGHAVDYMSAAGVRTLATVLHRADEVGASVVFCRFSGAAAECLVVSGFGELFDISESTDEARDRLKTKRAHPASESLHPPQTAG